MTREEERSQRIDRVVSAVLSLASAVARYETETEHSSMSGTYEEERELRDALNEVLP